MREQKTEPPSSLLLFLIGLFLLLGTLEAAPKTAEAEYPDRIVIQENTFVAQGISEKEYAVLGAMGTYSPEIWEDLTYKTLIKCLAFYESSYNPNAIGDHSTSFGLLQYQQSTWDMYCSGDIWNPQTQAQCADEMLKQDFSNIGHWTTAYLCL